MTTETVVPVRGVQIDCRAQRLTMPALLDVLKDLSRMGYNTILLEYYDRFPYRGRVRRAVADDAFTRSEIRTINRTACSLGLEIIPLVQSLGHLPWVLRMDQFASLREGGGPRATTQYASHTICPSHRSTRPLLREMTSEVLEMHPDCRYLHIGGDEAGLNADCPRCGPRLKEQSEAAVYLDHYRDHVCWVRRQGPAPIMWGDMILAHPQTLADLREHVVVMDWDYWSYPGIQDFAKIWGVRKEDYHTPARWPKEIRQMLGAYLLREGGKASPYPYVPFLRDRGCRFMTAPAARMGDASHAVPQAFLPENVIGSARRAHEYGALGTVVTSWALRRPPWPVTEHILLAGAMTLDNPRTSRKAIDTRFAEEHFGQADAKLGRIPEKLAGQRFVHQWFAALPEMNPDGRWFANPFADRVADLRGQASWLDLFRRLLPKQRKQLDEAKTLLARARPKTKRQKQRTAFWKWAQEVLVFCCDVGEQILLEPGSHKPATLRALIRRADVLADRTDQLLASWYTPRTLEEERQARFGTVIDWLESLLAGK